jgi:hypothetical protein
MNSHSKSPIKTAKSAILAVAPNGTSLYNQKGQKHPNLFYPVNYCQLKLCEKMIDLYCTCIEYKNSLKMDPTPLIQAL